MDKVLEYLKNNMKIVYLILGVIVFAIVVSVVISIVRKARSKKQQGEEEICETYSKFKPMIINDEQTDTDKPEKNYNSTGIAEMENFDMPKQFEIDNNSDDKSKVKPKTTTVNDNYTSSVNNNNKKNSKSSVKTITQEKVTNKDDQSLKRQKQVKSNEKTCEKQKQENSNSPTKTATDVQRAQEVVATKQDNNDEEKANTRYSGKWIIYKEDNRFVAGLKASNGEIMLRSESYSSLSGMKSGIDTLKKNIENENYAISLDKNGNFAFKIFSTANRLLCIGENYSNREQCEKAFRSAKRFAKTAEIVIEQENKNPETTDIE